MEGKSITRRELLRYSALGTAGALLAACAKPTPTSVPVEPTKAPVKATEAPTAMPPTTVPPTAVPATEAPSLAGKTYTLWGLNYGPHAESYKTLADMFEKKTGAKGTVEVQDWPIDAKVVTAIAAGTAPDVFCWMGVKTQGLIQHKAVLQIDDVVFKDAGIDLQTWFTPGSIRAYYFDGHYWGVPVEDSNSGHVVVGRTDWIEKAGDQALALWPLAQGKEGFDSYQQLWDLAAILQQKDSGGNVTVWGLTSAMVTSKVMWGIMRELGRNWWEPDEKKFYLDSPEAIEALNLLVYTPIFERKIEASISNGFELFTKQQVAMGRGNDTLAGEATKVGLVCEGVLPPSAVAGKAPLFVGDAGWGFEALAQTKNKETAIEFLKFVCTYDAQYVFASMYGGNSPALVSLLDSDIYKGDDPVKRTRRRCNAALVNSVYQGNGYGLDTVVVGEIVEPTIEQIRTGELTVPDAVKQMQEKCTEHLQEFLAGKVQA